MNYYKTAFSEASRKLQEQFGSRQTYSKAEKYGVKDGLSENEVLFIEDRDSFYMATVGENGFPYIQHRGGPKGFLSVLDEKTVAFLDFSGNKQYISIGNMATNDKVSLFLISYPHKARLKIYAKARVLSLEENPDLTQKLMLQDYKYKPERIILLHIVAYDWNCPQHITPRYTLEEIEVAFSKNTEGV